MAVVFYLFCMKLFMGMLFILFVIVGNYATFRVFSLLRFGMFNIFQMYFVWRTSHCLICFWPAVISTTVDSLYLEHPL